MTTTLNLIQNGVYSIAHSQPQMYAFEEKQLAKQLAYSFLKIFPIAFGRTALLLFNNAERDQLHKARNANLQNTSGQPVFRSSVLSKLFFIDLMQYTAHHAKDVLDTFFKELLL